MRRIRKRIRFMLCMAVILFAMTTAVMGCYQKDPDTVDIPGKTPSGTSEQQAAPIPTVNRQVELADAKSKNPDAVAWLYIPGAEVDDPVMQAEDNGYYLKLDENGEYAMWGCYYAHCENQIGSRDKLDCRADEDAFRGFVLRLLEHLVLLERDALRVVAFQLVKQQVQRAFEIRVALPHLRRVDHLHDHREVLLAHRRSVLQIQNERLQERRLRTVPERVRVFRVLRRRVRHKVRDKPQRVAVSAQIGEGIVMAAHIHKVQHRERDALLFKQPAHGTQNLALAVCDNI